MEALRTDGHGVAEARPTAERVRWLDGVRGAAASFVVLHHIWLATWPFYPDNRGPWWLGWLLYGHLAVAVFIVVSGYSLALAPVRHGLTLVGGARRFIRRRAWRILPAYWAALVISTALFVSVLQPGVAGGEAAKSFLIHAALLQDVFGNTPPNGTFWSIAVEWQIYFIFPLILLLAARTRMTVAIALTTITVLLAYGLARAPLPLVEKIMHLSPQFLALFGFGVLAAWTANRDVTIRLRRGVMMLTSMAVTAFLALAFTHGSPWMTTHWFWVDLIFGSAAAGALFLIATSRRRWRSRTLGSRPAVFVGTFSYSLYLMHAPVLEAIEMFIVRPLEIDPLVSFALQLVIVLPVILVACYAFFRLFERPFLERRDLTALKDLWGSNFLSLRWSTLRRRPGSAKELA